MDDNDESVKSQLEAQVSVLKEELELLDKELGTSNSKNIVILIQNMESQLKDLYSQKEGLEEVDSDKIIITGKKKVFYLKQLQS